MLAGIGADLGAIQCHLAKAHQPCLLAKAQHLNKQAGQGIQVPAAETARDLSGKLSARGAELSTEIECTAGVRFRVPAAGVSLSSMAVFCRGGGARPLIAAVADRAHRGAPSDSHGGLDC